MRRTNTLNVRPRSHKERLLFIEFLDASSACYNQINYDRRQTFLDKINNSTDRVPVSELRSAVKDAVTQEEYRQKYIQKLGSSTPQQLVQKNWEPWKAYFDVLEKYRDPNNNTVTDRPGIPGYWKEDGNRVLHTVIRNDMYTIEFGERSRLEIPVGSQLKEKYGLGYHDRLRLVVSGQPHWEGKQNRLDIKYDRDTDSFTAHQSVGDEDSPPRRLDIDSSTQLATTDGETVVAAVDIGANNLAAVTTTQGDQLLFHGRPLFEKFHTFTEEIARLQSKLPDGVWSSRRIRNLYRKRSEERDHAQDALIRTLGEWLAERGVEKFFVGALSDVREKHWSATVNEKTDLFWAHGRFRDRLSDVLEDEYGIEVCEESEAGTSSMCPECEGENVHRGGDDIQCLDCRFEGHSDLVGSVNFLKEQAEQDVAVNGSMARPVDSRENTTENGHQSLVPCLEWDDHCWRQRGLSTKEEPTNQSTASSGKVASGVSD